MAPVQIGFGSGPHAASLVCDGENVNNDNADDADYFDRFCLCDIAAAVYDDENIDNDDDYCDHFCLCLCLCL